MQINHANWRNPTEIKMFNSAFKNTAMSTLIATLVATTLSAVPAIAGEGGNMDRLIKYDKDVVDVHVDKPEEDQPVGQNTYQYATEPFTHTGLLAEDADQASDINEAYSFDATYRWSQRWSAKIDR